ncbi:hypothetical protein D3C81_2186060 [compost metagenome]
MKKIVMNERGIVAEIIVPIDTSWVRELLAIIAGVRNGKRSLDELNAIIEKHTGRAQVFRVY